MAFEYLSGSSTDLFNLIFREILKIDPSLLYKYTTLQDQVIYLILIPTVILFLFIFAFAKGIVGRIIGEHRGFQYLVSIITYIYLIYSGIFGTMLVPIFTTWLTIAVAVALIVFIVSVVFHPARGPSLMKLGTEAGKKLGRTMFEKQKKIKALESEIEGIEKEIDSLEHDLSGLGPADDIARNHIKTMISNLKAQKKVLEHEIDKLGG